MKLTKTKLVLDDILTDCNSKGEVLSLVEPRPSTDKSAPIAKAIPTAYSILQVTINYPRTVGFLNKNSKEQQKLYTKLWNNMKDSLAFAPECGHTFEYCASGQIHLHGYIKIPLKEYFICGIVSDAVKAILAELPKKYANYKEANYYPQYERYRCPSLCVQHSNTKESYDKWTSYITKSDKIVKITK